MRRTLLRTAAAAGAAVLATGILGLGAASANPVHTLWQTPVISGPDIGPASTPEGMFPLIHVAASDGRAPGETTFSVPQPFPYYYMHASRFVVVHWQNLQTGASGDVPLRYWQSLEESGGTPNLPPGFPATLPTAATVQTGSGPVVATVTHFRTEYMSPPVADGVLPGLSILIS
ncbi:hypothetical protein [Tomitella gaofuii]|uniref:hypothetical protein n=1 Tax=Tomitella gaofuii TaxID=2760083 RepID=UPI0015FC1EB8|nr:hypothetical protein [Tomitella gaofuii]